VTKSFRPVLRYWTMLMIAKESGKGYSRYEGNLKVLVDQILIDKHRELNVLEMLEQVAQRDFTSTKMV
jgi:hypothetical protein